MFSCMYSHPVPKFYTFFFFFDLDLKLAPELELLLKPGAVVTGVVGGL